MENEHRSPHVLQSLEIITIAGRSKPTTLGSGTTVSVLPGMAAKASNPPEYESYRDGSTRTLSSEGMSSNKLRSSGWVSLNDSPTKETSVAAINWSMITSKDC